MRTLFIVMLSIAAPALAQQAPASLDTLSRVDSVFASVNNLAGPGCSAGVGRDGSAPILRAYGSASLEFSVPNTTSTRFDAASVAKQFTAAAIGLLARQGKLSLDDDVRRYIPEMPNYGKPITLQHLIRHMSGVRDQWDLLWLTGGHDDDATEDEDVLSLISRQRALNFVPGTEFVYSNSGYMLLALVVRKVSGISLREFAAKNIFAPLGMSNTNFLDDRFELQKGVATGYRHARSQAWSPSPYLFDTYGPGGIFTTPADMLKWYSSLNAPIYDAALLRKGALANGDSIPYAMGLDIGTYRGNRYLGHGGNDLGANAYGMRFVDKGLSVVVLCNAREIDAYTMSRRLADIFLPSPVSSTNATSSAAAATSIQLSTAQLSRFTGLYFNPLTLATRRVEVRNGKLVWARGDGTPLDAIAPDRFRFPPGTPAELFFPVRQSGSPQEMQLISGSSITRYYAAEPFAPPRGGVKEYAGDYYSPELETLWHISAQDSAIHFGTLGSWGFDAQPIFRDAFAIADAVILRFTRDGRGRITGLVADMPRTRGVKFERR